MATFTRVRLSPTGDPYRDPNPFWVTHNIFANRNGSPTGYANAIPILGTERGKTQKCVPLSPRRIPPSRSSPPARQQSSREPPPPWPLRLAAPWRRRKGRAVAAPPQPRHGRPASAGQAEGGAAVPHAARLTAGEESSAGEGGVRAHGLGAPSPTAATRAAGESRRRFARPACSCRASAPPCAAAAFAPPVRTRPRSSRPSSSSLAELKVAARRARSTRRARRSRGGGGGRVVQLVVVQRGGRSRGGASDAAPRGPLPPCPRPAAVARSGHAGLLRRHRLEGGGPRIRPPAPTERRRRRTARWGRKWRPGAGRGKGEEGGGAEQEGEKGRGGARHGAAPACAPWPPRGRGGVDLHPLCWRRDFLIARCKYCRRGKTSIASPILRCVVEVSLTA